MVGISPDAYCALAAYKLNQVSVAFRLAPGSIIPFNFRYKVFGQIATRTMRLLPVQLVNATALLFLAFSVVSVVIEVSLQEQHAMLDEGLEA